MGTTGYAAFQPLSFFHIGVCILHRQGMDIVFAIKQYQEETQWKDTATFQKQIFKRKHTRTSITNLEPWRRRTEPGERQGNQNHLKSWSIFVLPKTHYIRHETKTKAPAIKKAHETPGVARSTSQAAISSKRGDPLPGLRQAGKTGKRGRFDGGVLERRFFFWFLCGFWVWFWGFGEVVERGFWGVGLGWRLSLLRIL